MTSRLTNPMRRVQIDPANFKPVAAAGEAGPLPPPSFNLSRQMRAARRVLMVLLFTPLAAGVQIVLLAMQGRGKAVFARLYWAAVARIFGLEVRILGQQLGVDRKPGGRPVIYVANHGSWLDIPAIGGQIQARFVSKDDVAKWPIVGTIARLGRTVFVSRSRPSIGREKDAMQECLAGGDSLILFPEGTSSDGSRVLPFHSSFFAAAYRQDGVAPLIQPVSVVYDRLAGLPVGRASRPVFAWYGEMSLAPHIWQIAQLRGKRVTMLFHTPLDPADFSGRKALSQATWQAVADGAATLRQNRPVRPPPQAAPIRHGGQAFA